MESNHPQSKGNGTGSGKRFEAKGTPNNTWSIFDSLTNCTVLKSVSPKASYNETLTKNIVDLLNKHFH